MYTYFFLTSKACVAVICAWIILILAEEETLLWTELLAKCFPIYNSQVHHLFTVENCFWKIQNVFSICILPIQFTLRTCMCMQIGLRTIKEIKFSSIMSILRLQKLWSVTEQGHKCCYAHILLRVEEMNL